MLQAAYGGYEFNNSTSFEDTLLFQEPGFDGFMMPLEISVQNEADIVFVLFRKRADQTGTTFDSLNPNSIIITATDAATGLGIDAVGSTASNFGYSPWTSEPSNPIVLSIESALNGGSVKSRAIDCTVLDTSDNQFISFRLTIINDDSNFHYIPIRKNDIASRSDFSISGREGYVPISEDSDHYILFSPYLWISETTRNDADFSYPPNSIYYKIQDSYGKENFTFSIVKYSNYLLEGMVSVANVPGTSKVGIILLDRLLYGDLVKNIYDYIDVLVTGEISGIIDTFRVTFYKG